ncbi:putative baseplate assembly protein [Sphaerotilaceae bacterium SBD11-9]
MSFSPRSPKIRARGLAAIRDALAANRRGYVPEWSAPAGAGARSAGSAWLAIAARTFDLQAQGLNAMPLRLQLEHLERLGASVLPAQPARAPLVFKLLPNAQGDQPVRAGTRVAAVLPPPAPSLAAGAAPPAPPPPEFFTDTDFTAMRGTLAALYSIDPAEDAYADHRALIAPPAAQALPAVTLFDVLEPVPHRLYLGHAELFRLSGSAEIVLTFDFAASDGVASGTDTLHRPLLVDWEYLSVNGWLPLTLVEDRTERFRRDGKVVLAKRGGPDAKEDRIDGKPSCWIRGSVADRVPAARVLSGTVTPSADGYTVELDHTRELLPGDAVTVDGISRARILSTTGATVTLGTLPDGIEAGVYLTLADALPPLRPFGTDSAGVLPQVDTVRARVGFARTDLPLDAALLDGFDVDVSKEFAPFGMAPSAAAAFYIACKDAFSRKGARITVALDFAQAGAGTAVVAAEYHNGTRWVALSGGADQLSDTTLSLTQAGEISFIAPLGWEQSEINSNKQFWLRLRIVSGDYGQPMKLSVVPSPSPPATPTTYVVTSVPATLAPPVLHAITVGYLVLTNPAPLDHCLAENDFAFTDHSENARGHRSAFAPFVPVMDRAPALHFGFSHAPPTALASVLAHVIAPAEEADPQPFIWDVWTRDGWAELSVRDTTDGLRQTGLIQFVGAPDAVARVGVGGVLYRIRARLKAGLAPAAASATLGGVWLNAVWARQGTRYERDALGISSGAPDQTFALAPVRASAANAAPQDAQVHAQNVAEFEQALDTPVGGVPVMAGEKVEVREWSGRGDDWRTAAAGVPEADLRFEADPQDPRIKTAVWVRWEAVPHLYASGPNDRHCLVEHARGVFRFPGPEGRVPPAGAPIVVSYVTGGGEDGNVPAGTLRELRSGVGFIESVHNPLAAGGGASAERLRAAGERNAQRVRHRDRAVSIDDVAWLAREASSEVADARALPLAAPHGDGGRGFVGLVLVPHSRDAMPQPSRELCARVLAFVRSRMPAGVADGLRIVEPSYVAVGVRAEILPLVAEEAGLVEARVRARLQAFAHPLTGGHDGRGWAFGNTVYLSDMAALIESIEGVDAVRFLQLMSGPSVLVDHLPLRPDQRIAAGESQLKLLVPSVPYALA